MNHPAELSLLRRLRQEILFARARIYRFGHATPLEKFTLPGENSPEIWVKREDLSPIKAYKWRGACNRMATLTPEEISRGVVTASAGNHAQGIALAAQKLKIPVRIYMPRSAPQIKQDAVKRHGGNFAKIILAGDSYDEAVLAARSDETQNHATYLHAYDDLQVMAGQGTIADEIILSSNGPFDATFLQVGGGGMVAGVSCWLRMFWPNMPIWGVEAEGQASMKAALDANQPTDLGKVDIFCDGTAVRKAGQLPFEICRDTLNGIITVSNNEVSHAIRTLWENLRCISEPSGALGLAAILQQQEKFAGKKILIIVSGANIDFLQLGLIAQSQNATGQHTKSLRIAMHEHTGSMLTMMDQCLTNINISDFQYGKISRETAWPLFTFSASNPHDLEQITHRLEKHNFTWKEATNDLAANFRTIPLREELLNFPIFLQLEFYERAGALHEFLKQIASNHADICYFNYRQSGESIGRALIGLNFNTTEAHEKFSQNLPPSGPGYRHCSILSPETQKNLLGKP